MASDAAVRLTVRVRGRVQGVGFRWWTRCRALELGLVGSASNLRDGSVQIVAEGQRVACERLLAVIRDSDAPGWVDGVAEHWTEARGGLDSFEER